MNKILIVVDYQHDFASKNGSLYVSEAETISNDIQERINDSSYDKIIYTFDTHISEEYEKSDEHNKFNFPIHCEYKTNGWNLFNINPRNNNEFNKILKTEDKPFDIININEEYFFTKNVFDIWKGNKSFPEWFENTINKDTKIDVVGVATNYCVYMNVIGLVERGYKVNIIENCVKGIADDSYQEAITNMKEKGVKFINNDTLYQIHVDTDLNEGRTPTKAINVFFTEYEDAFEFIKSNYYKRKYGVMNSAGRDYNIIKISRKDIIPNIFSSIKNFEDKENIKISKTPEEIKIEKLQNMSRNDLINMIIKKG